MTPGESGNRKQESDAKKQIVLVVDGKPMRQFYTSIFLQRLKYHVIMAKTAEDGISFTALTVPLVIIANIDLPDLSAVEFLKRVKQDRRTRHVPVIIYTSNKNPQHQLACEQAGCAAYLRHPATLEQLYIEVQKVTERKPRRFVRLDAFLNVTIGEGSTSDGSDKDWITGISELGMFVSTPKKLAYGSIHSFAFSLPDSPGWLIRVEGQIVHRHLNPDRLGLPGIGVKFVWIGDRERALIRDFIRATLMDGIAGDLTTAARRETLGGTGLSAQAC